MRSCAGAVRVPARHVPPARQRRRTDKATTEPRTSLFTRPGDSAPHGPGPARRGRARDPSVEPRALAAVQRIVAAHGVRGCSMSGVAQAAGLGKAVLYLRWPDVASLIATALEAWPAPGRLSGSPVLEEALTEALRQDRDELALAEGAAFLRAVIEESAFSPALSALLDDVILAPRRERMHAILAAGDEHGAGREGGVSAAVVCASLESLTIAAIVAPEGSARRRRDPGPHVRTICRGIRDP